MTETSLVEFNGDGSGGKDGKVVIGNTCCDCGDESDFSIIVVVSVVLSGNGTKKLFHYSFFHQISFRLQCEQLLTSICPPYHNTQSSNFSTVVSAVDIYAGDAYTNRN
ncbi:Hypothetical predicted protein [Octopus vulgaris]|uniref:Uncharacterized protein n=1 Tax=Octopus vulgaris TaxID=6645 RepID=A0AA36AWU9_OCTVU|nr:Hypothetical predicted protein [Octopus vulgaris]